MEMDEVLKEVLLKKCGNRIHDQVLIVENLPRKFLFEETRKLVPKKDREGWLDGTMTVDPSGEMVWTLYPGIERSQSGDGGFIFWTNEQESDGRLKDIMRYIDGVFPRDQRLPSFVDNAQLRGEMNTGPIPYNLVPRISLPAPISEPSPTSMDVPSVSPDERREAMLANLEKARAARKANIAA